LILGVTGSSNTFGITQTATGGNNVTNIQTNGSSNTWTIHQTR